MIYFFLCFSMIYLIFSLLNLTYRHLTGRDTPTENPGGASKRATSPGIESP